MVEKLLSNTEVLSLAVKSSRRFGLEKMTRLPAPKIPPMESMDNTESFWSTDFKHLDTTGGLKF